jgi:hypothetical protein
MLLLSSALLGTTLSGQTSQWPVERMHAPSSSLQRLPQVERETVMKLIRPELGPLFQGEAPSVADQAMRFFRAEHINLGAASAVALSPGSGELCGTTGNCSFWIVDLTHRRVVLHTDAIQSFAVDAAKPHMVPHVYTSTRNSASESEMIRWHYIDGQYERDSCATLSDTDESGAPLKEPRITSHPCIADSN